MIHSIVHKFQICIAVALAGMLAGAPQTAQAADLNIAQSPLFVATNVEPNVMFTLDDSGSMQWEYMPDGNQFRFTLYMFPRPNSLYGGEDYDNQVPSFRDNSLHNYFGRSAANNGVFYNPDITYSPWSRADGTEMPNANPTAALYNPALAGRGALDLTVEQTQSAVWFRGDAFNQGICDPCNGNHTYWPITYYNYNGGDPTVRANYTRVQITAATPAGATFTSPGGETRTRNEEIQNFANWFQYHRSRILTSRGAIGRAFTRMPDQARVGFAAINEPGALITEVIDFDIGGRGPFYDGLYDRVLNRRGTPLRQAANSVGQYFERTDDAGPWSTTPGARGGDDLACRQSFHILMSDGFWNGPNPTLGNVDNEAGTTITGPDIGAGAQSFTYAPVSPFRDSHANTLADVAMHYWKRDLRPDVPNMVSTTIEDPGFWQHLTSFGIGLGVEGNQPPDEAFAAIDSGVEINWADPGRTIINADGDLVVFGRDNQGAAIDDLLHFGVNGRGGFFSAADPETFANELGALLLEIVARTAATTGLSVSTTRLTQQSVAFAAEFDSEDWSGEVKAINVLNGNTVWTAASGISPSGRDVYTSQPGGIGGTAFNALTLDPALLAKIDSDPAKAADIVRYVRGEDVAGFRPRTSLLGDIVNSRPVFAGPGNEGWSRLSGTAGSDYAGFVDGKLTAPQAVYIGANDGMLHAFDAKIGPGGGKELFAFVPRAVLSKLGALTKEPYDHRFFVDGQQVVRDAYNGGWKRVLVGTLGAGGRGVYAIDVSDPSNLNDSDVLWEITGDDDGDLGFTFGDPIITRLGNGDWVAIFGNGYNSDDNKAILYVVDLFSGSVRNKIVLEDSSDANGLSGVAPLLDPTTRVFTRRVYAGDLRGTMWRVDFDAGGGASVKYANGLFSEPDNRPITSAPGLAASPAGGVFVYFGTGKLIEPQDRLVGSLAMEKLYAVRDAENRIGNTTGLGSPTITEIAGERTISGDGGPDGWMLNLSASGTPTGERALARPTVVFGRVVFTTFEPVEDPCAPGGVQRLYVLDALSGEGALDNICQNCGVVEIGIGAPIVPPIIISDPTVSPPTGDPANPFLPVDPGSLPDGGSVGAVTGWCRVLNTLNPATGSPLPIGPICDGRQVWRQVTND